MMKSPVSLYLIWLWLLEWPVCAAKEEHKRYNEISKTGGSPRKNVLFLVSDDMRPQLGAYQGPDAPSRVSPRMYTPHLDSLASRSLLLKRAYVQQAVCSPSRTSVLTGRRPDTTHVYDLVTYFRKAGGNYTTIPQYFKQHGYLTAGIGKIFHPGAQASGNDDPISWTEPYYHASGSWAGDSRTWRAVTEAEEEKRPLQDQKLAKHAIQTLQRFAPLALSGEQPFFLAVGFHRPHLPFVCPERFFQHYPAEDIKLPSNPYAPVNLPPIAWSDYDELRLFGDIKFKYGYGSMNTSRLPDDLTRDLRRAYYACVSYVDDLVGQLLDQLDKLGLSNNTVVSFFGDHGWQLGEHGEWCKHTNFELATHAPLMVRVPGATDKGISTEALTELVDLFPTLAEAAGLPSIPLCPKDQATQVETCTEGVSMMPLITNSRMMPLTNNPTLSWKSAAFSQYPRMATDGNIYMGYSMRTDRYRYTEWVQFHGYPKYGPTWTDIFHKFGVELYDHKEDPDENWNRAHDKDWQELRRTLSKQLHEGWRHVLPSSDLLR